MKRQEIIKCIEFLTRRLLYTNQVTNRLRIINRINELQNELSQL